MRNTKRMIAEAVERIDVADFYQREKRRNDGIMDHS